MVNFLQVYLTPTHLAIVMEYAAGGELYERICNAGRFSEDEVMVENFAKKFRIQEKIYFRLIQSFDFCLICTWKTSLYLLITYIHFSFAPGQVFLSATNIRSQLLPFNGNNFVLLLLSNFPMRLATSFPYVL